jgi:hypothetical protein
LIIYYSRKIIKYVPNKAAGPANALYFVPGGQPGGFDAFQGPVANVGFFLPDYPVNF